jgi:translation initiation factor IF-1
MGANYLFIFILFYLTAEMSVNMKSVKNNLVRQQRREDKNAKVEAAALTDPDVLFGKVIKTMGDAMFRVYIPNPKHKSELIEVTAGAPDRHMARICVNDIVIVVQSGSKFEIMGNVSARNIKSLLLEKRLHSSLVETGQGDADDGIEFEVDEPLKKVAEGDEALNVDDI